MKTSTCCSITRGFFFLLCWGMIVGCQAEQPAKPRSSRPATTRQRAAAIAEARLVQDAPPPAAEPADVPSEPVIPVDAEPPVPIEELRYQIPDPLDEPSIAPEILARELKNPIWSEEDRTRLSREGEKRVQDIIARCQVIDRPMKVRLSLTQAIRKALEHNYMIRFHSYSPAIETARIVEAEAQFDAVFFTNFSNNKQDRPSSSKLFATETQSRTFESGLRKLLSTGTQVSASYNLQRTDSNLVFQTLNPSYFNQFVVEFRQPFLRGFGLDFNRSQIEIRKLDRRISEARLQREVRETIYNVEQAYWQLWQTRRRITVLSRLLADYHRILSFLEERLQMGLDVYKVQVNLTRSRLEQREANFIQIRSAVKNAEDQLKALLNDPDLNLSKDIEIIPVDTPSLKAVAIDQVGEVTSALMNRSELHEAKLAIEQAQLAIGVAKNQALPRLDAALRYVVDGLGSNADKAFDQLTENNFHEYVVSVEFEYPIGSRAGEAKIRQARYQQAQAISGYRAQIEGVIAEVKQAIRDLQTNYDQIGPSFRSAAASMDQLRAIQQRQETRSPPNLEVELNAHEALATARDKLAQELAGYNLGLINLERRKGTLLQYNNIHLRGIEDAASEQANLPPKP